MNFQHYLTEAEKVFEPKPKVIGMYKKVNYAMNKPVMKDGTLANYAKMAVIIANEGPISREAVINKLAKITGLKFVDPKTSLNTTFAALSENEIASYDEKTKKWSKGDNYDSWVKKYSIDVSKLNDKKVLKEDKEKKVPYKGLDDKIAKIDRLFSDLQKLYNRNKNKTSIAAQDEIAIVFNIVERVLEAFDY